MGAGSTVFAKNVLGDCMLTPALAESTIALYDIDAVRLEESAAMLEAMETGIPVKIGGNVLNTGLITNLPQNACVEVPCLVDRSGIQPTFIGDLPEQCAALNRTNINVQLLTIEAARTLKKEYIYQAVMMDPHAGGELSIDDIVAMCDELIEAHEGWLPKFS